MAFSNRFAEWKGLLVLGGTGKMGVGKGVIFLIEQNAGHIHRTHLFLCVLRGLVVDEVGNCTWIKIIEGHLRPRSFDCILSLKFSKLNSD